ncbi:MAG: hypothetical protein QOI41_1693, partial [Myxococcales bacterium]|nr:hypothetical protein [Myxococcales bacterium]
MRALSSFGAAFQRRLYVVSSI